MNRKETQDLKEELNRLKEHNQVLFQTIVEPRLHGKVQEFLDSFEEYFRERGFVVRTKNDTVRVSFDTLHLKAFSEGVRDILIMRGKEQIASVAVKYIGEDMPEARDQMAESMDQLEKELEKERLFANHLKNPVFYYTGKDFDSKYKYDTPLSVLDSIFGI